MDTETKTKNVYLSDDTLLISFLLTRGITLLDIKQDSYHHFTFLLSNPDLCTKSKQDYLNNAPAPARELFANREMLISEIKKEQI